MSEKTAAFCVLYRWRLRAGLEEQFRAGWLQVTELYLREAGSLGSRLHKCDDGTWVAYAQWPSRAAWEAAGKAGSASEGFAMMSEAVEERLDAVLLETEVDRLR